jgi:hypothetical protein
MNRFMVMTLCFVAMLGSMAVLVTLSGEQYGVQIVSIVIDTAAVILYTFSANKGGMQPFMFTCPSSGGSSLDLSCVMLAF